MCSENTFGSDDSEYLTKDIVTKQMMKETGRTQLLADKFFKKKEEKKGRVLSRKLRMVRNRVLITWAKKSMDKRN
jgi:hypothetical protein